MTAQEKINDLIEQMKSMRRSSDTFHYDHPQYARFHMEITNFIYENGLDNSNEWSVIKKYLLVRASQYLNNSEADTISTELENLRRKIISNQYRYNSIFNMLHAAIISVSKQLLLDGHNAKAVESAFIEIENRVKGLTTKIKPDLASKFGKDLMLKAFSPDNQVIVLDNIADQSGRSTQEGYMHLFAGGISAFRNPNAHKNETIDSEKALRMLMFSSLLMYCLDDYEKIEG